MQLLFILNLFFLLLLLLLFFAEKFFTQSPAAQIGASAICGMLRIFDFPLFYISLCMIVAIFLYVNVYVYAFETSKNLQLG